jgi:hypothetical protein
MYADNNVCWVLYCYEIFYYCTHESHNIVWWLLTYADNNVCWVQYIAMKYFTVLYPWEPQYCLLTTDVFGQYCLLNNLLLWNILLLYIHVCHNIVCDYWTYADNNVCWVLLGIRYCCSAGSLFCYLRLINLKRHIDYFSKGPKSSQTDRAQKRRLFRVNSILRFCHNDKHETQHVGQLISIKGHTF